MAADLNLGSDSWDTQEIFQCCICLDLLYKPIVLICGHVSCFWCVHMSMNSVKESHCPVCRYPYCHFPSVCQMLHFLLRKMYPDIYETRRKQTSEKEKQMSYFSPEFDEHCQTALSCTSNMDITSSSNPVSCSNNGDNSKIMIHDVLCSVCGELLFRPTVLNCGHVFCETCLPGPKSDKPACPDCKVLDQRGMPKVCLMLDQFLEKHFPYDYKLRRCSVDNKDIQIPHPVSTSAAANADTGTSAGHGGIIGNGWVHIGVGCDLCGMHPIVGERYKCKDCVEKIGFDLCQDCYESKPMLPGRFNQKHRPEHNMEKIQSDVKRLLLDQLGNGDPPGNIVDVPNNWLMLISRSSGLLLRYVDGEPTIYAPLDTILGQDSGGRPSDDDEHSNVEIRAARSPAGEDDDILRSVLSLPFESPTDGNSAGESLDDVRESGSHPSL